MNRLSFSDVLLSVVSVVVTCEAIAPAARIGVSSLFWWIVLFFTFLIPYGKVIIGFCDECGYGSSLYVWIKKSMGLRWAGRITWYYWVNYVSWFTSVAVLFSSILNFILGYKLSPFTQSFTSIIFVACVYLIGSVGVCSSKRIINLGAISKILIAITLGVFGIYFGLINGFELKSTRDFVEDISSLTVLSQLSIILFNYMGLEVIASFGDRVSDPKMHVQKAIMVGGLAVCTIYLLSSFGIIVNCGDQNISSELGIVKTVGIMFENDVVVDIISILFMIALYTSMVSWIMGVSIEIRGAALNKVFPKAFSLGNINGEPVGAMLITSMVVCVLLLVRGFIPNSTDFFELVFSLNIVFALLSYVPMFFGYYRLRTTITNNFLNSVDIFSLVVLPIGELVISVILSIWPVVDGNLDTKKISLLILTILLVVAGEILERRCYSRYS